MTQLLLFDAPHHTTSSAAMAAATVDYARVANRAPQPVAEVSQGVASQGASGVAPSGSLGAQRVETHQAGVNHMGDLARLVLMRYDMLARRRAEIAARHAG